MFHKHKTVYFFNCETDKRPKSQIEERKQILSPVLRKRNLEILFPEEIPNKPEILFLLFWEEKSK